MKIRPVETKLFACGRTVQTGRLDEANGRLLQFYERASKEEGGGAFYKCLA